MKKVVGKLYAKHKELNICKKKILFFFISTVFILFIVTGISAECSETDNGKDYSNIGMISGNQNNFFGLVKSKVEKQDYCKNNKVLVEFFCENEFVEKQEYKCAGKCEDGKCVAVAVQEQEQGAFYSLIINPVQNFFAQTLGIGELYTVGLAAQSGDCVNADCSCAANVPQGSMCWGNPSYCACPGVIKPKGCTDECGPEGSTMCGYNGAMMNYIFICSRKEDGCLHPEAPGLCSNGCTYTNGVASCIGCTANCVGKACGASDNCGGICRNCPTGQSCESASGTWTCVSTPDCTLYGCAPDGNACTNDYCNPATKRCEYQTIPGCGQTCTNCVPNNLCDIAYCQGTVCMHTAKKCPDQFFCGLIHDSLGNDAKPGTDATKQYTNNYNELVIKEEFECDISTGSCKQYSPTRKLTTMENCGTKTANGGDCGYCRDPNKIYDYYPGSPNYPASCKTVPFTTSARPTDFKILEGPAASPSVYFCKSFKNSEVCSWPGKATATPSGFGSTDGFPNQGYYYNFGTDGKYLRSLGYPFPAGTNIFGLTMLFSLQNSIVNNVLAQLENMILNYNSQTGTLSINGNALSGTYAVNSKNSIAVSNNNGQVKAFVNGNKVLDKAISGLNAGGQYLTLGNPAVGKIAAVRVTTNAPTENELATMTNPAPAIDTSPTARRLYLAFENDGNDGSGNSNTATFINGGAFLSGKKGTSVVLVKLASPRYVKIQTPINLGIVGNKITLSIWMKTNTYTGTIPWPQYLIKKGNWGGGDTGQEYTLYIPDSTGVVSFNIANDALNSKITSPTTSAPIVNDGRWHHIAAVLRNTNAMELYIDGSLAASGTKNSLITGPPATNTAFLIGAIKMTAGQERSLNGQIDEVEIYNYDLTAAQIRDLYSKTNTVYQNSWSFENNLNDAIGGNNFVEVAGTPLASEKPSLKSVTDLFGITGNAIDSGNPAGTGTQCPSYVFKCDPSGACVTNDICKNTKTPHLVCKSVSGQFKCVSETTTSGIDECTTSPDSCASRCNDPANPKKASGQCECKECDPADSTAPTCPTGLKCENKRCVPECDGTGTSSCPAGKTCKNNACVAITPCTKANAELKENECICKPGFVSDGGNCVCPSGTTLSNNKCISTTCSTCDEKTMELNSDKVCQCKDDKAQLVKGNDGKITCVCVSGYSMNANTGKCECADPRISDSNGNCVCKNGLKTPNCCPITTRTKCEVAYTKTIKVECRGDILCESGKIPCDCKPKTASEICKNPSGTSACASEITCGAFKTTPFSPLYPNLPTGNLLSTASQADCGVQKDGCGKFADCDTCNQPAQYKCDVDEEEKETIKVKKTYCNSNGKQETVENIYQYGDACKVCSGPTEYTTQVPSASWWEDAEADSECDLPGAECTGDCGKCQIVDNVMQCVKTTCTCSPIYICKEVPDPNDPRVNTEQVFLIDAYKDSQGNCQYADETPFNDKCKTCDTCRPAACDDASLEICENPTDPKIQELCDEYYYGDGSILDISLAQLSCRPKSEGESCNLAQTLSPDAEAALRYMNLFGDTSPTGSQASTGRSTTPAAVRGVTGGVIYQATGDDEYIISKNNLGISGNSNWTISTWVFPMYNPDSGGFGAVVLGWGGSGAKQGALIYYNSDKKAFQLGVTGVGNNIDAISYNENNWYHVVETYNGTDILVYINNIKAGSKSINSLTLTNGKLYLVVDPFGGNRYFNGSIGETKIWNYALGESEISSEYTLGNSYPVAYYPFEENALDYSGNLNDGTMKNGASFVSGRVRKAISLNGNQYVELGQNEDLSLGKEITISAWVMGDTDCAPDMNEATIIRRGLSGSGFIDNEYELRLVSGVPRITFGNSSYIDQILGTKNVCDLTWHNIIAVLRNNNSVEIYVDGAINGTGVKRVTGQPNYDFESPLANLSQRIGADMTLNMVEYPFKGSIDEVKIWRFALSPEEIKQEYRNGLNINKTYLDYSFDEPAVNNITKDDSFMENHGTLFNYTEQTFGKIGYGYTFDSNKQNYIMATKSTGIYANRPWTVSLWVYPFMIRNLGGIFSYGPASLSTALNNSVYIRYVSSGAGSFNFGFRSSVWRSFTGYPPQNWYHVVETYNGSDANIYINNVLVYSGNIGMPLAVPPAGASASWSKLWIGRWMGYSNVFFSGTIDEVKVWNYALTDKEVSQEYTRGTDRLSLYMPFNGDTKDYSGLGNDGIFDRDATPYYRTGKKGAGFLFSNGIMSINNSYNLELGNEITIGAWISGFSSGKNTVIKRGKIDSNDERAQEYVLYGETSGGLMTLNFVVGNLTNFNKVSSITKIPLNVFNHVAVILRKNNQIEIYINGKLDNTAMRNITNTAYTDGMLIGKMSNLSTGNVFGGVIDELKVWKYALSPTEIREEYDNGNRDLKIDYTFNENYLDYSGNMNDANLTSSSGAILASLKFDIKKPFMDFGEWFRGLFG